MWDRYTHLYFLIDNLEKALRAFAAAVRPDTQYSVELTLPSGKILKLPFLSDEYKRPDKLVIKTPGTLHLWCEIPCSLLPETDTDAPSIFNVPVRLVVVCGRRYVKCLVSRKLEKADVPLAFRLAGRELLSRILNDAGGVLGAIDPQESSHSNPVYFLHDPEKYVVQNHNRFPSSESELPDNEPDNILQCDAYLTEYRRRQGDWREFYRQWVKPFFPFLKFYRFLPDLDDAEQAEVAQLLRERLPEVTDKIVDLLLNDLDPRYPIIALSFIMVARLEQFTETLITRWQKRYSHSYLALACLNNDRTAAFFEDYLVRTFPVVIAALEAGAAERPSHELDHFLIALMHYDRTHGTQRAQAYTRENGLWPQYVRLDFERQAKQVPILRAETKRSLDIWAEMIPDFQRPTFEPEPAHYDLTLIGHNLEKVLDFARKYFGIEQG